VSSDSHGNEAVVASYYRATDVQSKRDVADGDRPLDHYADQGTGRHLVADVHQHAVAADIHRPACTLYLLWPLDGVTSNKLDREASLPAALRFIQGSQILAPLVFFLSDETRRIRLPNSGAVDFIARAGLAPRVASVMTVSHLVLTLLVRRLSQDSMTCCQLESHSAQDRKVLVIPDWAKFIAGIRRIQLSLTNQKADS
jgi:hypothetical protein